MQRATKDKKLSRAMIVQVLKRHGTQIETETSRSRLLVWFRLNHRNPKFQKILFVSFSSLGIFNLSVWPENCLHSSRLIIFPPQSCILFRWTCYILRSYGSLSRLYFYTVYICYFPVFYLYWPYFMNVHIHTKYLLIIAKISWILVSLLTPTTTQFSKLNLSTNL